MSGSTSRNRAALSAATPGPSSFRVATGRVAGTYRAASRSMAIPIGTFTQNTARQPEPSRFAPMSSPPMTCPPMVAMPITTPSTP
jgi:hypothetical protein